MSNNTKEKCNASVCGNDKINFSFKQFLRTRSLIESFIKYDKYESSYNLCTGMTQVACHVRAIVFFLVADTYFEEAF